MTRLIASAALARYETRRAFALIRWLPTVMFTALPLVIFALVIGRTRRPEVSFYFITTIFYFRLVPMAMAVLHGLQASTSELNEATATYLYSGSLPRSWILLTKLLTLWAFLTLHLLLGLGLALFFFSPEPAASTWPNFFHYGKLASFSSAIWLSYFMCFGFLFRRPMAVSVTFALVFEFILSGLPFDIAPYSIYQSLRGIAAGCVQVTGGSAGPWHSKTASGVELLEPSSAWLYLGIVVAVLLAAGMLAISRRSIAGRTSAE